MDFTNSNEWERYKSTATKIMEELLSSPCSEVLRKKKTPKGKTRELSFEIINANIKKDVYKNKKEWIEDCKDFLDNDGWDPVSFLVVKFLSRKFLKLIIHSDHVNPIGWWRNLIRLEGKLDKLLRAPPELCAPYNQLIPAFPFKKENLTKRELGHIASLGNNIKKNTELAEIISILEPQFDALTYDGDVLKVEMKKLPRQSILELNAYLASKDQNPLPKSP